MRRLKYKLLKWLGFNELPDIKISGASEAIVRLACHKFYTLWKAYYGQDIEYLFHGLQIKFSDKPVLSLSGNENYGIADVYGVTIWKNAIYLGDTALVHELIHYVKRATQKDPDIKHTGQEWREGFESPVKRVLKSEGYIL